MRCPVAVYLRYVVLLVVAMVVWAPTPARAQTTGWVEGRVTVTGRKDKGDHSKVVIEIHRQDGVVPVQRAEVHQKNQTFTPELTVITKNSTVDFPNDDKIFHNVFSLSRAARFDLGLYKSGTSKSVKFRRPGVVNIYCNIHPNMVSQIRVVDTPHYATTDRSGRFRIAGIAPGRYPVSAWVPYGDSYRGEIVIEAGKAARLDLAIKAGRPPRRHLRKDGTPYGRYR